MPGKRSPGWRETYDRIQRTALAMLKADEPERWQQYVERARAKVLDGMGGEE